MIPIATSLTGLIVWSVHLDISLTKIENALNQILTAKPSIPITVTVHHVSQDLKFQELIVWELQKKN